MRVLAIIFGILLILPGLCFLGFGLMFSFQSYMNVFGIIELVVGGLLTWAAVALLTYGSR